MPRQINVQALQELEGQVIEPIPPERRADYKYWRAVHLGAVALNFLEGRQHLNNAWGADHLHFWDNYAQALTTARELVAPDSIRTSQFSEVHRRVFARLTGMDVNFRFPAMVLALDAPFNESNRLEKVRVEDPLSDSLDDLFNLRNFNRPLSPGGGYVLYGYLTPEHIDSHARAVIESMFPKLPQKQSREYY